VNLSTKLLVGISPAREPIAINAGAANRRTWDVEGNPEERDEACGKFHVVGTVANEQPNSRRE